MMKEAEKLYLRALGARILSEANDLKRTTEALASDLNFPLDRIKAVIAGEADRESAHEVIQALVRAYPISLADLWVDEDDTDQGVRIVKAAESAASTRTFERRNREGIQAPYYEYRDTAMSRTAPFKPEWIRELRVVDDSDPENPDVAYNNGHLMHQATFFVGPVNFYWEINERRYCAELNTGDSNYITPFVPHSFAVRNSDEIGYIIAVTYGGEVRRAMSDLGRLGAAAAEELAADPRRPDEAFVRLLGRQAAAESMVEGQLIDRLIAAGFDETRARRLVSAGGATPDEIAAIAGALNVRPADLMVSPLDGGEEVVVKRGGRGAGRSYPSDEAPAYELFELARTQHQPDLKGFDVSVVGGLGGDMRHSLHEYVYNYGETPVDLVWGAGREASLAPGDSGYVRPMVTHRYLRPEGTGEGRLVMIRIPGALTGAVVKEFSTFVPLARSRVIQETKRWF